MIGDTFSYSKVSVVDEDDANKVPQVIHDQISSKTDECLGKSIVTIRHDSSGPISRPPTKQRDRVFGLAFIIHFVAIFLTSLVEQKSLSHSFIMYGVAGSWSSLLMIVTLIGGFLGGMLSLIMLHEDIREYIMFYSLAFSIIFQICLGNILLLIRSNYSLIGIIILLSAFVDSFQFNAARENIKFSSSLVQFSLEIGKLYGSSLFVACACIVILQTLLLLWWGAFFVGILSEVSSNYADYLILMMAISLYWIAHAFNAFMSYVIGGCILWYFMKEDRDELAPSKRVTLYMRCAMTTSFGTLCKGALFCPTAQSILALNNWSKSGGAGLGQANTGIMRCCSMKRLASILTNPMTEAALRYNKLAYCLTSTFGRTLCKAAEEQSQAHPETIRIAAEDSTSYTLNATSTAISGLMAITIGLLADQNEGSSWPLFFIVIFYLNYCGISIVLHAYSSAVDALVVAFSINPEKFAAEHQIIFLRFLRTTESALR